MAAEAELRDDLDPVGAWRAHQLKLAGYGPRDAAELARRHDVDLHLALRLVAEGCPTQLALKILL